MQILYTDARCGDGKTYRAIEAMVETQGRYVFVVDRRSMLETRVQELRSRALNWGTNPEIVTLSSTVGDARVQQQSVTARITTFPNTVPHYMKHIILLITHEGMKQSDLSLYVGWKIIIDEVPGIFEMTSVKTPAMKSFFEANYILDPISSSWSQVKPRKNCQVTLAAIRQDDTLINWAQWHKRVVSRQGVVTDLLSWSDMEEVVERWSWWSLWSPRELEVFDCVTILANAFLETITYGLTRHFWPDIEFVSLPSAHGRTWAPREVEIHYFAHHSAGSYFWSTAEGERCLNAWGEHIASLYPLGADRQHLWTCNASIASKVHGSRIGGDHPSPRVAGSNQWSRVHHASMAYSAKPSNDEIGVLKHFGIDFAQVQRSREYEDIIQFALRTSLRDAKSSEPVVINLYDVGQAEFLAAFLRRNYGFDAEMSYVDIGIGEVVKPKRGRRNIEETSAEREIRYADQRKQELLKRKVKREADKAARIAAGNYRPRGRPTVGQEMRRPREERLLTLVAPLV